MIKFTKMQGLGNDFVCMKYDDVSRYDLKNFSKFICDRHFGIGADGVVLYDKSDVADCKIRIFNSDGSEAEMCGNGIRGIGRFLYDKKIVNKTSISIETLAGIKKIDLIIENNNVMAIRVNMGKALLLNDQTQVYIPQCNKNEQNTCKLLFKFHGKEAVGTFLSIGNPHTVFEVEDVKNYPVAKHGKIVENYKYFPEKTNVEFVQIINENNVKLRVWERGAGETLACGTGASATVYALYKDGKVKNETNVELEGGNLKIIIDESTDEIYMEGAAVEVFEGEIDL